MEGRSGMSWCSVSEDDSDDLDLCLFLEEGGSETEDVSLSQLGTELLLASNDLRISASNPQQPHPTDSGFASSASSEEGNPKPRRFFSRFTPSPAAEGDGEEKEKGTTEEKRKIPPPTQKPNRRRNTIGDIFRWCVDKEDPEAKEGFHFFNFPLTLRS